MKSHPGRYVDHIYGEHEVGGTSWMYLASEPFENIGFPKLGDQGPAPADRGDPARNVPVLCRARCSLRRAGRHHVGHGLPEEGLAQAESRATSTPKELSDEESSRAGRGKVPDPRGDGAARPHGIGLAFAAARFLFGIGEVSNLSNQNPWGIWIGIDVASGVALAAGGFTTGAIAYVFNREQFHAVIRPALLTAMLGYTFVVIGLLVDIGRYWNIGTRCSTGTATRSCSKWPCA